jgi:hypothetical protein
VSAAMIMKLQLMFRKYSTFVPPTVCIGISVITYCFGRFSTPESETAVIQTATESRMGPDRLRKFQSEEGRIPRRMAVRASRETRSAATIQEILKTPNFFLRIKALQELLDRMAPEDFTAFFAEFSSAGGARDESYATAMVLTAWAQKDPVTALMYINKSPNSRWSKQTLIKAWAAYDPLSAEDWVMNSGDDSLKVGLVRGILSSSKDLGNVTRLANTLENSSWETQARVLGELGNALRTDDLNQAMSWIDQIENPNLRKRAIESVVYPLGSGNPGEGLAWIETINNLQDQIDAIATLTYSWVEKDPIATMAYVRQLPREIQLSIAFKLTARSSYKAPEESVEWLNSLGSDPRVAQARQLLR